MRFKLSLFCRNKNGSQAIAYILCAIWEQNMKDIIQAILEVIKWLLTEAEALLKGPSARSIL